jgi:hypothetical protein
VKLTTHLHAGQAIPPCNTLNPCAPSRVLALDLNAAFDRLCWSSLTAPGGPLCFDAFATTEPSLVVIADPEEDLLCEGATLLRQLTALVPPCTAETLRGLIQATRVPPPQGA